MLLDRGVARQFYCEAHEITCAITRPAPHNRDYTRSMNRALVLACGNTLRGDDGAALHIVRGLQQGGCEPETLIHFEQQWTPELAEAISEAELVIFVDASRAVPPGEISCQRLNPIYKSTASSSHQTTPASLLALAEELYKAHPAGAFLVTIGGASFELTEELSEPVRKAVPHAVESIKALLSGVTLPEPSRTATS
jgi:hydrogenase maturation protease